MLRLRGFLEKASGGSGPLCWAANKRGQAKKRCVGANNHVEKRMPVKGIQPKYGKGFACVLPPSPSHIPLIVLRSRASLPFYSLHGGARWEHLESLCMSRSGAGQFVYTGAGRKHDPDADPCVNACRKIACQIQLCLARNGSMQNRCENYVQGWKDCCDKVKETAAASAAAPVQAAAPEAASPSP
jgi:hypothetical protein